jgi:hypothetical protein
MFEFDKLQRDMGRARDLSDWHPRWSRTSELAGLSTPLGSGSPQR